MIELQGFENIEKFIQEVDLAFAEMDRGISSWFEGMTKHIFKDLVMGTPQYTGDMASHWHYSIGQPDNRYSPIPNKIVVKRIWNAAQVFHAGDSPAVLIPMLEARSVHPTWRDVVWFNNPTPIAPDVENLRIKLRSVNLVDNAFITVQYIVAKYSAVGQVIQPSLF